MAVGNLILCNQKNIDKENYTSKFSKPDANELTIWHICHTIEPRRKGWIENEDIKAI